MQTPGAILSSVEPLRYSKKLIPSRKVQLIKLRRPVLSQHELKRTELAQLILLMKREIVSTTRIDWIAAERLGILPSSLAPKRRKRLIYCEQIQLKNCPKYKLDFVRILRITESLSKVSFGRFPPKCRSFPNTVFDFITIKHWLPLLQPRHLCCMLKSIVSAIDTYPLLKLQCSHSENARTERLVGMPQIARRISVLADLIACKQKHFSPSQFSAVIRLFALTGLQPPGLKFNSMMQLMTTAFTSQPRRIPIVPSVVSLDTDHSVKGDHSINDDTLTSLSNSSMLKCSFSPLVNQLRGEMSEERAFFNSASYKDVIEGQFDENARKRPQSDGVNSIEVGGPNKASNTPSGSNSTGDVSLISTDRSGVSLESYQIPVLNDFCLSLISPLLYLLHSGDPRLVKLLLMRMIVGFRALETLTLQSMLEILVSIEYIVASWIPNEPSNELWSFDDQFMSNLECPPQSCSPSVPILDLMIPIFRFLVDRFLDNQLSATPSHPCFDGCSMEILCCIKLLSLSEFLSTQRSQCLREILLKLLSAYGPVIPYSTLPQKRKLICLSIVIEGVARIIPSVSLPSAFVRHLELKLIQSTKRPNQLLCARVISQLECSTPVLQEAFEAVFLQLHHCYHHPASLKILLKILHKLQQRGNDSLLTDRAQAIYNQAVFSKFIPTDLIEFESLQRCFLLASENSTDFFLKNYLAFPFCPLFTSKYRSIFDPLRSASELLVRN